MYLAILGDQSLIFNWRWGSCHVYIAILLVFGSSTSLLCLFRWFGSAPTLLVQVDWVSGIALWVPTLSVKSLYNISQNGWFGVMVRKPFGSGTCLDAMVRKPFVCRTCLGAMVREPFGSRTCLGAMVREPFGSRTCLGFLDGLCCACFVKRCLEVLRYVLRSDFGSMS